MAKVYMFPQKKELPKALKEQLEKVAKEYVGTMQAITLVFGVDEAEGPKYEEVLEMVANAFAEGIIKAIDELE